MINPWLKWFKSRVDSNTNANILVIGRPGIGKSWTSLSLAVSASQILGTPFDVEKQCVFSIKDLVDLINGGTMVPGSVIVYDEAGIDADAQKWASIAVRGLKWLMETYRHRRYIVIFTTPYPQFFMSAGRVLMDAEFEIVGRNDSKGLVSVKPFLREYNPRYDKVYFKFLRVQTDKGSRRIKRIVVSKPPLMVRRAYERKKTEFTTWLYETKIAPMVSGMSPSDKDSANVRRGAYCKSCEYRWRPQRSEGQTSKCSKCGSKNTVWDDALPVTIVDA